VAHWARTTPDAVALECRDSILTFRALDEAARRVADRIQETGVAPGSVVALSMERSLEMVVVLLGVLTAGCAYLPLDVHTRAEQIVTQAAPSLVITDTAAAPSRDEVPVLDAKECLAHAGTGGKPQTSEPGLAYVMPTSGSGGVLKLVEVTHANVCYNVQALRSALGGISPRDAYLHFASFSFSSSVRQLFLPLLSGARVVIAVGHERRDPQQTLVRVQRSGVTVLDLIPSFLAVLVDTLENSSTSRERVGQHLRLLLLASERLPGGLIQRWDRTVARRAIRVYNMYGQTETTGIVCVHRVEPATTVQGTVPIGHPIPGTEAYLLDSSLNPVAAGTVGEIVVAGGGLARGYRADAARTAVKFPAYPAGAQPDAERLYRTGDLGLRSDDGTIQFVGREDGLVKVRGQQVDLAEIERVLGTHPAVAEAIVADVAHEGEEVRIRAFVRCRPEFVDERVDKRLRLLPNGLRILDLNPAETDFMYREIFVREVYVQHGIELPENACVIDAGANIGLFSLSVATRLPHARVFAFEPAAPIADVLKMNVLVNSCPNVSVRVQGFSDHRGVAALTFYPHTAGMSSVHPNRDEEHATLTSIVANQLTLGEIPEAEELRDFTADLVGAKLVEQTLECVLIRLSDFIDAEAIDKVDLLKVDVQKSELDLLSGIREEHWQRIKQIVVEVHDIGGRRDRLAAHLSSYGYAVSVSQDAAFAGSDMYYLYARREAAQTSASLAGSHSGPPAPARQQVVSGSQLASFLADRMAAYQLPESVEILPDFPRTVSGKVDRSAIERPLPWLGPDWADRQPEEIDPFVAGVMAVWAEVLNKPVKPADDFFEVGGNSLSAARVITRIRERYAPEAPIRLLFEESRLELFATRLRALRGKPER
jgi:amino acid adenylation domain-containing protein/FkbM family methyltransferase